MIRLITLMMVCGSLYTHSIWGESSESVNSEKTEEEPRLVPQPFEKYTDSQLSVVATEFESLSAVDRRALLTELRKRISDGRPLKGRLRVEQKFGSIEARDDGTIVRMKVTRRLETTKSVRQTSASSARGTIENNGFGSVNGEKPSRISENQNPSVQINSEVK